MKQAYVEKRSDGSWAVVQNEEEQGTITPVAQGKDKGGYAWVSHYAVKGMNRGTAATFNAALANIGFLVFPKEWLSEERNR